jgi:hypothetical protein
MKLDMKSPECCDRAIAKMRILKGLRAPKFAVGNLNFAKAISFNVNGNHSQSW